MPCYSPVPAWPDLSTGRWVFSWNPKADLGPSCSRTAASARAAGVVLQLLTLCSVCTRPGTTRRRAS